jgi:hypothetical protein
MTKYVVGITGSLAGAALGVWLVIAQFILAYQPRGVAWVSDAWGDLFTGIAVLVISLAGVALYGLGLRHEIGRPATRRVAVPARAGSGLEVDLEELQVEQRSVRP